MKKLPPEFEGPVAVPAANPPLSLAIKFEMDISDLSPEKQRKLAQAFATLAEIFKKQVQVK